MILTAKQFDNFPFEEDKRYELDEGELIVSDRPCILAQSRIGESPLLRRPLPARISDRRSSHLGKRLRALPVNTEVT